MSNFPEPNSPAFVPVYQLQRTDAVDAGAAGEGPSNLPLKNLVERTAYLKKEVEDLDTAVGGLGTIATQNSNNVSITGGSISGIIDLAIADGGTGASTAANARTNLGAAPLASPTFTGTVTASDATASTSTTTGALVVTGGLGVGGRTTTTGIQSETGTTTNAGFTVFAASTNVTSGLGVPLSLRNSNNTPGNYAAILFFDSQNNQQGSMGIRYGSHTGIFQGDFYIEPRFVASPSSFVVSANGNVGIDTSSPAARLHVDGTIRYTNRPAAGTITPIGFDANGDLRASSSSLRYKHDIQDLETGLEEVMQLRPVQFKFNGETRTNMGFIAEEVAELGLEDVMLRNEENQPEGVIYANMVSLLTKAIQEQQAQIEELKAEINLLKGV